MPDIVDFVAVIKPVGLAAYRQTTHTLRCWDPSSEPGAPKHLRFTIEKNTKTQNSTRTNTFSLKIQEDVVYSIAQSLSPRVPYTTPGRKPAYGTLLLQGSTTSER